jgi:3-deoxy-7-phosphoheptulonate synthase
VIIQIRQDKEDSTDLPQLCAKYTTIPIRFGDRLLVITSSSVKSLDDKFAYLAEDIYVFENDIQLASAKFKPKTEIIVDDIVINEKNTLMIAGPCSIESEEQIRKVAKFLIATGVKIMRAGAYKPRTSPYTFQGMGTEGLNLLRRVCNEHGLKLITEARDSSHIEEIIETADMIQVGAKAMYDQSVLRACGETRKPILLKRGFGSTLQEFVQAAEFILSGGNPNVILCERGIRTFETKTRFTLDLCGVSFLKTHTNLPVFLDPSHAMGYAYGVADLTRACVAMGVEGLLIETHPDPSVAKSDASQQLNFAQFSAMYESLKPVAAAVGRRIT